MSDYVTDLMKGKVSMGKVTMGGASMTRSEVYIRQPVKFDSMNIAGMSATDLDQFTAYSDYDGNENAAVFWELKHDTWLSGKRSKAGQIDAFVTNAKHSTMTVYVVIAIHNTSQEAIQLGDAYIHEFYTNEKGWKKPPERILVSAFHENLLLEYNMIDKNGKAIPRDLRKL